jgi:hypothetical protein
MGTGRSEADVESICRRHLGTQGSIANAVAASGAWTADHIYIAHLWWYQEPFRRTLSCRFSGEFVRVEQQARLSLGSTAQPTLEAALIAARRADSCHGMRTACVVCASPNLAEEHA